MGEPPSTATHLAPGQRTRTVLSAASAMLASALTVLAALALWVDAMVDDTDRYVAAVAPLAHDPAIQQAVASRATEAILTELDLPGLGSRGAQAVADHLDLPPRASALTDALAGAVSGVGENQVRNVIGDLVASPQFAGLWQAANRAAHAEVVSRITGDRGDVVQIERGTILVDLQPVVAAARETLIERGTPGASLIPDTERTVVLAQSEALASAERYLAALDTGATWLPWAALAAAALALLAANRRRVAVAGLGAGVAVVALGLLAGVSIGSGAFEARGTTPGAVTAIVDQLLADPLRILRALTVVGLVLVVAAWVSAPGPRARVAQGLGWVRTSAHTSLHEPRAEQTPAAPARGPATVLVLALGALALLALMDLVSVRIALSIAIGGLLALALGRVLIGGHRSGRD